MRGSHFNEADFSRAEFYEVYFDSSEFKGVADFSNASYLKKVIFSANESTGMFGGKCNFRDISTDSNPSVIFEKTNLEKASFLGTDIENFVFRDIDWYCPERPLKWLKCWTPRWAALVDEFEKTKKTDLSKLEDNYHQLVLSHEKRRDFDKAMEFRKGEMEVKRKRKGTTQNRILKWFRLHILNTHALYKYLSSYGTSYWRAFVMLVVMLFFFSGIFLFSGFQPASQEKAVQSKVTNYELSTKNIAPLSTGLKDYLSSVEFSFSILTLQRSPYYEAVGPWSKTWVGFARIAFYSQVALLLLALRRRFKQ